MPLSPNSILAIKSTIQAVFAAAVYSGIIKENPLDRCIPLKAQSRPPNFVIKTRVVFLENLAEVKNITIRALIATLLFSGMRVGEARALLWSDLDFESGLLKINKSVSDKGIVTEPKTRTSVRFIRLVPQLINLLAEYKKSLQIYIENFNHFNDINIIFPNKSGNYITEGLINSTVKQIIKDTDIPKNFHTHSLRHSFASFGIMSGAPVTIISAQIGHSSPKTTLEVYAHAFMEQQAKLMSAPISGAHDEVSKLFRTESNT